MLVRNSENVGFAAACNQGAKESRADYLLFLNPDIILFQDSLGAAVRFMDEPANIGVGICGIQLVDEQGRITPTCSRFPKMGHFYAKILGLDQLLPGRFPPALMTDWRHDESKQVDAVMGAFMLVRHSVFEQLCGFDERFFVYFEDVDLPFRACQAGWTSYYFAGTQACHSGHGCTASATAASLFYSFRSRILYGYKHFTWMQATGVLLATTLLEPFSRIVSAATRHDSFANVSETVQAYLKLWRAVPSLFRHSVHT